MYKSHYYHITDITVTANTSAKNKNKMQYRDGKDMFEVRNGDAIAWFVHHIIKIK